MELDGLDISQSNESLTRVQLAKQLQMIFQDPFGSLNPVHTIARHIERPIRIHRPELSNEQVQDLVIETLETVGLTPA